MSALPSAPGADLTADKLSWSRTLALPCQPFLSKKHPKADPNISTELEIFTGGFRQL
jgi:hypothetical protein